MTGGDDDVLFDPLGSDEPVNIPAVRADDALIDAIKIGDVARAQDIAGDSDDELIALLAVLMREAQAAPEAE